MAAHTLPAGTAPHPTSTPLVNELLRAGEEHDVERFDALFDVWLKAIFARASASHRERAAAEELTRAVMIDAARTAAARL